MDVRPEVANGQVLHVKMRGTAMMDVLDGDCGTVTILVDNVYYDERFSANLLCLGVLVKQGWEMHATQQQCYVKTPGGIRITLNTLGRLFMLDAARTHGGHVYSIRGLAVTTADDLVRLHETLGHMDFDKLVGVLKAGKTLDLGKMAVAEYALAEARQSVLECHAAP